MKNLFNNQGLVLLGLAWYLSACSTTGFEFNTISNGIEFTVDGLKKRVLCYSEQTVRVSVTKSGEAFVDSSLVVLSEPEFIDFTIEDGDDLILRTAALTIKIDKRTGVISYQNNEEDIYLEEHGELLPELRDTTLFDQSYFQIKQTFKLTDEEGLYGLGQFENGVMNYQGRERLLVQSNMNAIVPVLTSTKNYGILWDNYSNTVFKDGEQSASFSSTIAEQIDYYFMAGADMDGVISAYRELTGMAPLFSKKAYGFWQSKERYRSFDELHQVVKQYRDNRIPLDNIIQDWNYWGDWEQFSSMYFEPKYYPNPKENIQRLNESKVELMVSLWPALGTESMIYKEMDANGLLYNQGHFSKGKVYDAYSHSGRDIYWKHIKEGLVKNGIHAFWIDGTEPQFFQSQNQQLAEEEFLKVEKTAMGPVAKYLNTYALVNGQGVYEKHRAYTDKKRAFILTRSSFAGQQRNGMVTWSGDISANYETLKNQIRAGVNFSMAGVPYWTHDIGAFFPAARGGNYLRGIESSAYQELYTRWFQLGAFTPIFRSHGTGTPREVWQFKDRNPICYNALLKALDLRYQLMPYLYSTAWRVTSEGYSFLRGLPMDFPQDIKTYDIDDQFLFGNAILVKPITKNMYYEIEGIPPVIPSGNLETPKGESGLYATFYEGIEKFNGLDVGKVLHKEVNQSIDFDWNFGDLPAGVPATNFWVYWEGNIIASETGTHKISLLADDGYKVYLSGEKVGESWGTKLSSFEAALVKGRKYPIRIEYAQGKGDAQFSLCWEKPSDQVKPKVALDKTDTVYLPQHPSGWYDLWTNEFYKGGQEVVKEYPMDVFPLFVKAGSIIPFGPKQQYVDEKPDAPIEIRVYSGADAKFLFYEDEGDTYNYEKGVYNTIQFSWNEAKRTLLIGESTGAFEGYSKDKIFHITLVEPSLGTDQLIKRVCAYEGERQTIVLDKN